MRATNRSKRRLLLAFGAVVLAACVLAGRPGLVSPVYAEKPSRADAAVDGPAGVWRVEWVGASNSEYIGVMTLAAAADGTVTGQINWRLTKTPRTDLIGKIEFTGVEYVEGVFTPSTGLLVFEGARKDDPDEILGLDLYRLLLSPNGKTIAGMTANGGNWTGRLWAFRG
jgi:hypothetical protein